MISVIIPVYNSEDILKSCLKGVFASDNSQFECIVVNDGSTDNSMEVAKQFPVKIIDNPTGPEGPANSRNYGAEHAQGEILFFIDADVVIKEDTISKVLKTFNNNPQIAALFGSYDEDPNDRGFLSQYKNLLHHYVHQRGQENAISFWSGCGAIKRDVFFEMGGFDGKRYPKPSIEDIELGYRLRSSGYQIMLNKEIQVTHLKKWSLGGLLRSDIIDRALPWTQLILKYKNLPNDLNLQISQRVSAILLVFVVLYLGLFAFQYNVYLLPLLVALFLLLVGNRNWYEDKNVFHRNLKGEKRIFLLISTIIILALLNGQSLLLAPLVPLLFIMLIERYTPEKDNFFKRLLFVGAMAFIAADFIILLISFPLEIIGPPLVMLAVVLLLNQHLYRFFLRKRGLLFTLAVIPFHLLYYLYSFLAFIIGGGLYYWNTNLRARAS